MTQEERLHIARNLIVAGIEMAFQVTGSGLAALEETETAMGAFLAAHKNQVSVAQPGSDITLNYYAAPGESTETAKQRAREMFNELVLQASRA
ncbi:hypothetical protein LB553_05465 [Mesorhizobium sp. CA8]|uniref:hypothetical protein n=1 Tax=Mesorhizobium sp. CA8 TaxID=2876637 RepID=UPI001CCEA10C|nr:hypothetical protein [Mesorhizobium sp. CA8]MBZ9760323.1 hypothetical protein [Mesorhizobium sp. CA8]